MTDVIQLLRDLVAIPSVNPSNEPPDDTLFGEGRVVAYLEDFFRQHRIPCLRQEVEPGRENLIARLDGASPEITFLEAHTDTVSVEGMEGDPFDPRLTDGKVFGRGACDCKASLSAMATALVRTARRGTPPTTCIFVAACGEEYRFTGARGLVARRRASRSSPPTRGPSAGA